MKMMWFSAVMFPGAGVPPPELLPPLPLPELLPGLLLPGLGGGVLPGAAPCPPHEDIPTTREATNNRRMIETNGARCNTRVFPFNNWLEAAALARVAAGARSGLVTIQFRAAANLLSNVRILQATFSME